MDSIDCSPPGSSVHGFSREEYSSGLPLPPLGDLPDPGTELTPLHWQMDSLPLSDLGSLINLIDDEIGSERFINWAKIIKLANTELRFEPKFA